VGIEAQADWHHLHTPETYLGYGRGDRLASPDIGTIGAQSVYELPASLPVNHWALSGKWTIEREHLLLDEAGGSITYQFHARDAHLVLSRRTPQPIPFRVLLDGQPPGHSHGGDVDEDGHGVLDDGRLYQLVRARDGYASGPSRSSSSSRAPRRTSSRLGRHRWPRDRTGASATTRQRPVDGSAVRETRGPVPKRADVLAMRPSRKGRLMSFAARSTGPEDPHAPWRGWPSVDNC